MQLKRLLQSLFRVIKPMVIHKEQQIQALSLVRFSSENKSRRTRSGQCPTWQQIVIARSILHPTFLVSQNAISRKYNTRERYRRCYFEVKCRKELWLQWCEVVRSNYKRTQSREAWTAASLTARQNGRLRSGDNSLEAITIILLRSRKHISMHVGEGFGSFERFSDFWVQTRTACAVGSLPYPPRPWVEWGKEPGNEAGGGEATHGGKEEQGQPYTRRRSKNYVC